MKIVRIKYKKNNSLITRGIKILVDDNLTSEEIREEVLSVILDDLDVSKYEYEVSDSK